MRPRLFHLLLLVLVAGGGIACSETSASTVAGPEARLGNAPEFGRDRAGPGVLSVLTWNVYYGTDLTLALGGAPGLNQLVGLLQGTDMPGRAAAIADQIAASRPHLVGLQEVGVWTYDDGSVSFELDFLSLLLNALDDHAGVSYRVARQTVTFDPPPLGPLGFTESLVVLARDDLETTSADGGLFDVGLPISELGLTLTKGWASVDARLKGRTYRFVTTHLEPTDFSTEVQQAQAAELLSILEATGDPSVPVIVTGDLNSEPDAGFPAPFAQMREAGFVDTWLVGRPRGDGYTANQDAELMNEASELSHRIDYVLYRDPVTADGGPYRGAVHVERLGEEQADRTDSGLWPSDHAGVLSTLRPAQSAAR